jgi:hypothetical protein
MPYKDPEKNRAAALERKRRFRLRQHVEKFGEAAGDMRGKHGNHARGPAAGRWSSDRMLSSQGYVLLRVGNDHPLAFGNGYAYEHLIVWASAGRELPGDNELLHHANEVKSDNRLHNLEKIARPKHGEIHATKRDRDSFGRFLTAGRLLDGRTWDQMPERQEAAR